MNCEDIKKAIDHLKYYTQGHKKIQTNFMTNVIFVWTMMTCKLFCSATTDDVIWKDKYWFYNSKRINRSKQGIDSKKRKFSEDAINKLEKSLKKLKKSKRWLKYLEHLEKISELQTQIQT